MPICFVFAYLFVLTFLAPFICLCFLSYIKGIPDTPLLLVM